ncbi:MAG TPA: alpha/beta hydrolase [Candidatus Sulfotelmatobacter sp.]|nr:alpha/beta hydrolase [Candidatus Sulfotelmatobacter sp.]
MPTLQANGLEVAYSVEGAGPPVVMLHGASSSAREDWSAQLPSFRKAFRVYLPDARGHGGTRWDASRGFSTDLLVADLAAFVDALGLTTFHLVGFSLGAMTALTYATRHADRLRTLLIAGIDTEREPRSSVARHLMDAERIASEEPAWAAQLDRRHGPVQGPGAWRVLMAAIAHDIVTQALLTPAELRQVRVPTLLAYGDRDVFAPLPHVVALYRQLPDARLLVAPDCDHQVMVSRPGLFNDAAAAFYRETEAVARARASGDGSLTVSTIRGGSRAPIPKEARP